MERAANLAKFLLEIDAVKLNPGQPFVWTSGIQSPIYCDNRSTLFYPHVRSFLKQALSDLATENFSGFDVVAGIATAGIPHAVLVAEQLQKPMCYVRPEPKKHGLKNQIEGGMPAGSKVLLVEDLISTGKSSLQAAAAVKEAGAAPIGLVALFSYGFEESRLKFAEQGIPFHTLCTLDVLAQVAVDMGRISASEMELVRNFAKDPQGWGARLSHTP